MKRKNTSKNKLRQIRHNRLRHKIKGDASTPRLSVFRGLRNMTAQLIDDEKGQTLVHATSKEVKGKKAADLSGKVGEAFLLGELLAEKAVKKGIKKAVFDRGGYYYHGRVKALADGARSKGLEF